MMKKCNILLLLPLLASCQLEWNTGENNSASDGDSTVEVVEENLKNAVEALNSSYHVDLNILSSLRYHNPFYAGTYDRDTGFLYSGDYQDEGENVRVKYELSSEEEVLSSDTLLYRKADDVILTETLKYDNTIRIDPKSDYSSGGYFSAKEQIYTNHFTGLKADDFTKIEENKYTYNGTLGDDVAWDIYGLAFSAESVEFTLEGDHFTRVSISYKDIDTTFVSASDFTGAPYTRSLKVDGRFSYEVEEIPALEISSNPKIEEIDAVLAKFDKNYTIQSVNTALIENGPSSQIIVDGENIAFDVYDFFTAEDALPLDTLSWLDAVVRHNENGYYVDNLSLNEETESYQWLSTPALVLGENPDTSTSSLYYETLDRFYNPISEINSSLFTYDETISAYRLDENAALYFGEAFIPLLVADTAFNVALTPNSVEAFRVTGSSFILRIVDSETIQIDGTYSISLSGSAIGTAEWTYILTKPNKSDTSAFYSDVLPVY